MHRASCGFMPFRGITETLSDVESVRVVHKVAEGSNHEIWINPVTGCKFTIPRHPSQEVKTGTANSIYKAAGLK